MYYFLPISNHLQLLIIRQELLLKDWVLLLIPAVALFAWYWGFWRKFDPTSNPDRSSAGSIQNQLPAGYQLGQSGNKRYLKRSPTSGVKKAGVKKTASRKKRKK
jgi:hypothetical protein